MYATNLRSTGQYRVKRITETVVTGPVTREPKNLNQLRKVLDPAVQTPLPMGRHLRQTMKCRPKPTQCMVPHRMVSPRPMPGMAKRLVAQRVPGQARLLHS